MIHPPREHHSYDEEFTVILGDWYHDEHSVLIKQFMSIRNPGGAEPVPSKLMDARNRAWANLPGCQTLLSYTLRKTRHISRLSMTRVLHP